LFRTRKFSGKTASTRLQIVFVTLTRFLHATASTPHQVWDRLSLETALLETTSFENGTAKRAPTSALFDRYSCGIRRKF
jgi:hypothetical protein